MTAASREPDSEPSEIPGGESRRSVGEGSVAGEAPTDAKSPAAAESSAASTHAPPEERITELAALKVFTHPLRIELFRLLAQEEATTASHLAEQVDEAVSLVSYHLRRMAAHGFLVEAEGGTGDGRERWWRLSGRAFAFRSSDFDGSPEGTLVAQQVARLLGENRARRYEEYLRSASSWGPEWAAASFAAEHVAYLTSEELRAYGAELDAVAARWRARGEAQQTAGRADGEVDGQERRERVAVQLYGFPFRPCAQ